MEIKHGVAYGDLCSFFINLGEAKGRGWYKHEFPTEIMTAVAFVAWHQQANTSKDKEDPDIRKDLQSIVDAYSKIIAARREPEGEREAAVRNAEEAFSDICKKLAPKLAELASQIS